MTPSAAAGRAPALLRAALAARRIDPASLRIAAPDAGAAGHIDVLVCAPGAPVDAERFRCAVNRLVTGGWLCATVHGGCGPGRGHERVVVDALAAGWLRLCAQQRGGGGTDILARKIVDIPRQCHPAVVGADRLRTAVAGPAPR